MAVKDRYMSKIKQETKPWIKRFGRLGYFAFGGVFILLGVLAFMTAAGAGRAKDSSGALQTLSRMPYGSLLLFFYRHRPYRLCDLDGVKRDQGHGGARKQQARPVAENRKLFQCRCLHIHRLECLAICVWPRGRRHFRTDVVRLCIGAAVRPMAHRAYGCGFYRICDCSIYERRSGCFYERIRYIKNEQTDDMHHEKHRTRRQYRPGHYFLGYRLFSHQDSHDR